MSQTSKTTLKIAGISCGGCARRIDAAIRAVDGVCDCRVDLAKGEAGVTYDPQRTGPGQLADAVTQAGYRATVLWEQLI